ncbi:nucleoside triphosphate pyrophosphohydrolase [Rhodovibrionaceae bacterium A322]
MSSSEAPDNLTRLLAIMARLRDPETGCPWDVEQTFATIAPYTIEEAYEVAEAISDDDMPALEDELGDLLLQVVFHARMAEEGGHFDFNSVAGAVSDKMIRRHPHVFADQSFMDLEEQTADWESRKAAERAAKGQTSALDGVASGLPALLRSLKLQKRAARVGFDWPDKEPVFAKIQEELTEVQEVIDQGSDPERLEDEVGDLLFAAVNLARHLKVDPESALRHSNRKFEKRFKAMETLLTAEGKDLKSLDLEEMETGWQAVKQQEKS